MSAITIINGNIFQTNAEIIVNPVNCVGVSGSGLAKKFKERYPDVHSAYSHACDRGLLFIGSILVIPTERVVGPKYVACFPTKTHWRNPSDLKYINDGLISLKRHMVTTLAKSVAIPALGCGLGGLDFRNVLPLIKYYFENENQSPLLDCKVEVYPPRSNFGN